MDPTTEKPRSEFSPFFIRWLVALTVMTLSLAFILNLKPDYESKVGPLPWVTAGGIIIQQGLDLFSGQVPAVMTMTQKTAMLVTLLAAFVIGPTILFFSWRHLAVEPKKSALSPANIGFFFGAAITSVYAVSVLLVSIAAPGIAASMRSAQALGEDRDKVIRGVERVALDAYQYKILPKTLRGGGGSYAGYRVAAELGKNADGEFQLSEATDSTITISGASLVYQGAVMRSVRGPDGKNRGSFDFIGQFR